MNNFKFLALIVRYSNTENVVTVFDTSFNKINTIRDADSDYIETLESDNEIKVHEIE